MNIRKEQLDQLAVERLLGAIVSASAGMTASPEVLRAMREVRRRSLPSQNTIGLIVGAGFAAGAFLFGLMLTAEGSVGAAIGGAVGVMLGIIGGSLGIALGTSALRMNVVHGDLLGKILPFVSIGREERSYWETISALANAGAGLDEEDGERLIFELNQLLVHQRQLLAHRARLEAASGSAVRQEMEAELRRIEEKLAVATDLQAREDLQKSLELCSKRLANLGDPAFDIQRIDAQAELVTQTLATIRDTIVRRGAATERLEVPELGEMRASLEQLNSETAAVEAAVQEVLSLQAGSSA